MNTAPVESFDSSLLSPFRLSHEQIIIMRLLSRAGGSLTQDELQATLGADHRSLVLTLIELQDRCLVDRVVLACAPVTILLTRLGATTLSVAEGYLARHS